MLLLFTTVLTACGVGSRGAAATLSRLHLTGSASNEVTTRVKHLKANAISTGTLDGFYTDPNHFEGDSFAGTRMISTFPGTGEITLVGSDDGKKFWTLGGRFKDQEAGELLVDFSPKGGPKDLAGKYSDGKITWPDGNAWVRASEPPLPADTPSGEAGSVGGFYIDPNHYKKGTFEGTRFVSDAKEQAVTLIGSDNGSDFWRLLGSYDKKVVTVDFSPKGGPGSLKGEYGEGKITWPDGNSWRRPGVDRSMAHHTSFGALAALLLLLAYHP